MGTSVVFVPLRASAAVSATAVCSGMIRLNFNSPLTPVPAASSFGVATLSLNCTGLASGPITVAANSISSLDASCEDILAQGTGSITWNGTGTPVTMVFAGPTAAEGWTALDNSGANSLQAAGTFAWLNPAEITACLEGGTSTVTLTGAFVIVT